MYTPTSHQLVADTDDVRAHEMELTFPEDPWAVYIRQIQELLLARAWAEYARLDALLTETLFIESFRE